MKNILKKVRRLIEKMFNVKFTRSLVVDITNDLYEHNIQLQKRINNLELSIREIEKSGSQNCLNVNDSRDEFSIVNNIWRRNGATESLENRLEFLSESSIEWDNCPHEIWLIYISILLEKGKIEKAESIWKMYFNKFQKEFKWLHRYIMVCKFVEGKGMDLPNIAKAAKVYDSFCESRQKRRMEVLLENAQSIAVVGNGPSEIGLNKGNEIDNHDIVIRFNNFKTYGFEQDYGKKTSVWVKCSNDDIKHDKEIYDYDLIVYEADYMHHPMEYGYHEIIYHDIELGKNVDYLDFDLHSDLRNRLGEFPSTGLLILWLITKLGILYKTDIYGFSFLQKSVDSYASHYFNDRDVNKAIQKSKHHSFDAETKFVNSIYSGKLEETSNINDSMNEEIFNWFRRQKKEKEQCECIDTIHSITHRPYTPNGGSGGGGAVLSCQKILIGDNYKNKMCKYTFFESNRFTKMKGICDLHDLWGAALFAIKKVKDERNTIYITHDYGTAFGLYLMGKEYVYINHLQGPRLEEKTNFGEKFSEKSALIIKKCEKMVFENARFVCYPSQGAAEYFENSKFQIVDLNKYNRGPVLYNTLYAFPKPEVIDGIEKRDAITILSVGQLTIAKGIDQCVPLIREIVNKTNNLIRWIIVGKGPLKEDIIGQCETLKNENAHFDFDHIEKCTYRQMQYLQNISDVYMMRQRISIFDLTTLEVMKKGKVIVLSEVGGNTEFNKENNILLCNDKNVTEIAKRVLADVKNDSGRLNVNIYNRYFSNDVFRENYGKLFDLFINNR
ncbi:glycosyltransferase family 29 protein [Roseburia inulinivorans]